MSNATKSWLHFSWMAIVCGLLISVFAKPDQYISRKESVVLVWAIVLPFWAVVSAIYWVGVVTARKDLPK